MKLHPIQEKLLAVLSDQSLEGMSIREVGELVDETHPQKIVHHLEQLEKKGFIRRDSLSGSVKTFKKPTANLIYLPLYGAASCGSEGLINQEYLEDEVPIPTQTIGILNPDNLFLVRAKGKSMEPRIYENDLVIAREQDNFDNGNLCVVINEGLPMIKKVIRTDKGYFLMSFNTNFDPIEVTNKSNNFRLVGVVQKIISSATE